MNVHARFLRMIELQDVVLPVVERRFRAYGFQRLDIREDETSDGLPVIRIVATVERTVPAAELFTTLDMLISALRAQEDDRIVFLDAPATTSTGESVERGDI